MSILTDLLGERRRERRQPIMGDKDLYRWEDEPERRKANNGMGCCRTGRTPSGHCIFGGIGCDVDHAWIAFYREEEV